MNTHEYDLAILGAGAAGLIAADFAVHTGAKTALLENNKIGGDCTWSGCVPSKSLIKVANVAHDVRRAARFGIRTSPPVVDMTQVRDYLRATVEQIYGPTRPENLQKKGMDVFPGVTRFLDAHTLEIGRQRIRAKKILICTGAAPRLPAVEGLKDVPHVTYRTIFDNDRLPRHLLVIGGGPVGCEIAQAYRRLGSDVTIFSERLLAREEPEVSAIIGRVFAEEEIRHIPARAKSVRHEGGTMTAESGPESSKGDLLLVAVGRAPRVHGFGLETAGVRYSDRGIEVDEHLQTSVPHIYAAGDVIGGPQYSHLAGWQGFQAVRNVLFPGNNRGTPAALPRITFTSPEVAQIVLTERAARERFKDDLQIKSFDIGRVDRAVNENDRLGLLKIIARHNGMIVGASIVGERAGEAITEISVAMSHRLTLSDLSATVHPYPTYSSGVQLLATAMAVERSFSGIRGRFIRGLAALRR
jgi:pyruvate/2-oxoglutarate dehydrogenase complex dihydrolipoamide dehydrogenase (E3) component